MTITRTNENVVIQTSASLPLTYLDELVGYITVKEILSKSEASDEDIAELANQVTANWWLNNKDRLLRGHSH